MKGVTASRAVEKCRERIYSTLEDHCKRMHSDEPARFAKLLLRLPSLRSIGLKSLEHLFFRKLLGDTPVDSFLNDVLTAAVVAHESPMDDSSALLPPVCSGLLVPAPLNSASTASLGVPQYLSSQSIPAAGLPSANNVSATAGNSASSPFSRVGGASPTAPFFPPQQQSPFMPQSAASGGFTFPSAPYPAPAPGTVATEPSNAPLLNLNPYATTPPAQLNSTGAISPASGAGMQATTGSAHSWTRPF